MLEGVLQVVFDVQETSGNKARSEGLRRLSGNHTLDHTVQWKQGFEPAVVYEFGSASIADVIAGLGKTFLRRMEALWRQYVHSSRAKRTQ